VTIRHAMALLAAINAMVALYLHLWKIGLMGALRCGANHGCEIAQFSSYGYFLGVDVALIGTIGYSAVFAVSLAGTLQGWVDSVRPTLGLQLMIWPAVLFTLRLKYGEFVVLKTFCPWCAISAVSITILAILVTLDARRISRRHAAPA
jgi:uncharacterized membrane protein